MDQNTDLKLICTMFNDFLSPISTVNPSHTDSLKDDNDDQRQCGGIVVKHCHEIVAALLREEQANDEAQGTATHCNA